MKKRPAASTLKKIVLEPFDQALLPGYLNPALLGRSDEVDVLTLQGKHMSFIISDIKAVYFVRDLTATFSLAQKVFRSRPKINGLWVRLLFRDQDVVEGVIPNNLLDLIDSAIRLNPPDLRGNTLSMFVPRSSLLEMSVVAVIGATRRRPITIPSEPSVPAQTSLFSE